MLEIVHEVAYQQLCCTGSKYIADGWSLKFNAHVQFHFRIPCCVVLSDLSQQNKRVIACQDVITHFT